MIAPFPYYGGKRRLAPRIWNRLGYGSDLYIEPFAGSIACLLARPQWEWKREVICDLDVGVCNFWRAIKYDHEEVAYWADYPSIHQDLTSRHTYITQWISDNTERMTGDSEYFNAKVAGWWVWGISLWIGGGWCHRSEDVRPFVGNKGSGRGVSKQVYDKRPRVPDKRGGHGVSKQRSSFDKRPFIGPTGGGQGVNRQVKESHESSILQWFTNLHYRLEHLEVLCGSFEKSLEPDVIDVSDVAIFMDPPYLTDNRGVLYGNESQSNITARSSFKWAVRNGDKYRIAYCCHEGDFDIPQSWSAEYETFGGPNRKDRRASRRDCVMFSPCCESESQVSIF